MDAHAGAGRHDEWKRSREQQPTCVRRTFATRIMNAHEPEHAIDKVEQRQRERPRGAVADLGAAHVRHAEHELEDAISPRYDGRVGDEDGAGALLGVRDAAAQRDT